MKDALFGPARIPVGVSEVVSRPQGIRVVRAQQALPVGQGPPCSLSIAPVTHYN